VDKPNFPLLRDKKSVEPVLHRAQSTIMTKYERSSFLLSAFVKTSQLQDSFLFKKKS
jgi:hypothetical protein